VPGNLTILDWAGFKGAVSYTFDDANSSQIASYEQLNALGVPFTFYVITSKPEMDDPMWARAIGDGHELGNHSHTHQRGGTGADVDAADAALRARFGITVHSMASPFGDPTYIPLARERYLVNRGVVNGVIAANDDTDPVDLPCFSPAPDAPASAIDAEVDMARAAGGWKVVLVHGFTGGTDGAYHPIALGELVTSVKHAKALGDVWIGTVADVGAYWRAQKLVSAVVPTTSGDAGAPTRTWTWKLPAHFPPGRTLRVRVDGGTLTQHSNPVPWNDHGYYEIALDAGSLTLGP
jgi:peptidoglycan/xylan/chitin deacetylase (PgdA/CDA1 family)